MKISSQHFGLALIVITLTAACTSQPKIAESQVIDVSPSQIIIPSQLEEIIGYYDFVLKKTGTDLTQEFENTKQNFTNKKNEVNRLKYVLLLATPRTSFHNKNAALELLQDWPQLDQSNSSLHSFRNLLLIFLTEQQRTNHTINNLTRQLKTEQAHVIQLKKVVSDIKDMEKNLLRRMLK